MRFLVDAQLPPALARFLAARGHEAEHVADLGLAASEDGAIWQRALAANAVIFTKDEDFPLRLNLSAGGPSVVWIRFGNTSIRALLERLDPLLPQIVQVFLAGEKLIELV